MFESFDCIELHKHSTELQKNAWFSAKEMRYRLLESLQISAKRFCRSEQKLVFDSLKQSEYVHCYHEYWIKWSSLHSWIRIAHEYSLLRWKVTKESSLSFSCWVIYKLLRLNGHAFHVELNMFAFSWLYSKSGSRILAHLAKHYESFERQRYLKGWRLLHHFVYVNRIHNSEKFPTLRKN